MPYLKQLGVDAVWLSPFYPSQLADGGYDVDDYRAVPPRDNLPGQRHANDNNSGQRQVMSDPTRLTAGSPLTAEYPLARAS